MQLNVPDRIERQIEDLMATGKYGSVSELLAVAVQVLCDFDVDSKEELKRLHREIEIGIREADEGLLEPLDIKQIIAECRAEAGLPPSES